LELRTTVRNTGLTTVVSSLTGLVGGGLGGALLPSILGMASNATGGMDAGALLGNVLSGGVGGALLTVVIGLIKKALAG
jgi:hypothetical protein